MAGENQREFRRSGTAGKCTEARELIIVLQEEFQYIGSNEVLEKFTVFIRKGCYIIKKGEPHSEQYFTAKDKLFNSKEFMQAVKENYTELINEQMKDDRYKLEVYKKNSIFIPTKKIGKSNKEVPNKTTMQHMQ